MFSSARNKPIVCTDTYEFGYKNDQLQVIRQGLFSFTLLRRRQDSQLVNFGERAIGGQKWAGDKILNQLGLEPIPNTPEEILKAVIEMNDWIDGKLVLSDFDEELQTKFYNCYPPETRLEKNPLVRISPSFLRKYQDLL